MPIRNTTTVLAGRIRAIVMRVIRTMDSTMATVSGKAISADSSRGEITTQRSIPTSGDMISTIKAFPTVMLKTETRMIHAVEAGMAMTTVKVEDAMTSE